MQSIVNLVLVPAVWDQFLTVSGSLGQCFETFDQALHFYIANMFKYTCSTEMLPFKLNIWWPGWCGSMDWAPACQQRVTGSIPSQGPCLVAGWVPSKGCMRGNHTLMFLSLFKNNNMWCTLLFSSFILMLVLTFFTKLLIS